MTDKLFQILEKHMKNNYQIQVGDEEKKLLIYIFNQLENTSDKDKKCLSKTIKIIIEKLKLQKEEQNINTTIISIDSRDRNYTSFPNSHNYLINIEPIKNVISIELLDIQIPNLNNFNITENNNLIFFQETEEQVYTKKYLIAEIPYGNYTLEDLKKEIEFCMNNKSIINANYTFDISTFKIQKKINIRSNKNFNLIFYNGNITEDVMTFNKFATRTIAPTIGFQMYNYTKNNNYTAPNCYDLNSESYLFLYLNNYECINTKKNKYFAKILNNKFITNKKIFSPPLKQLNYFDIKFLNYSDNFYNFYGLENSMTLKIESI